MMGGFEDEGEGPAQGGGGRECTGVGGIDDKGKGVEGGRELNGVLSL